MMRTILASPWLPLLYWATAVIALICDARNEYLKRRLGHHESQTAVSALASTSPPLNVHSSPLQPHPAARAIAAGCEPAHFWYPRIAVLQRPNLSGQRLVKEIETNRTPISTEAQSSISAPTTMLSIRADSPEQTMAKTLAIQCRTSVAISNAHGRNVTIHGVVTQEVVSSTGKILIMAGSKVVGSGLLDPENGRFKSDGLWSIFFDDTELKVQARLLDRPAGLPGVLGYEASNEVEASQMEAVVRDGRSFFVPRNAPFALDIHGEILLRDLKSNEESN
jgi:hypothetical protein